MANSIHKVAQLGAGRMGQAHLGNAAANPRLHLVAVVDPRPDVAEVAARYGATPSTFEAVLQDKSIEGVIVATSTDLHLDQTLACLKAGKAVFCEKPLDLALDRLIAEEAALRAADDRLFLAFNRRFDPGIAKLRTDLRAGAVGDLESLHIVNHDPAAPPAHFLPTSGGLFKDFTIHDFDMAAWLLPDPIVEVFAWATCLVDPAIAEVGDTDTARIFVKDARGRLCSVSNTRRSGCGYDQRIEAYGSKGRISVGDSHTNTTQRWTEAGAEAAPLHPGFMSRYADAYRNEMDHFADILDGVAKPMTGYEASVASLALAEAAAESVKRNAPVRL